MTAAFSIVLYQQLRIQINSTNALHPINHHELLMPGNINRGYTGNLQLQIILMVLIQIQAGLRRTMQPRLTDMLCVLTYSLVPEEKLRRKIGK